ncbi:MAG TPA: VOC family protein [Arenicellales bacterium]|nr:VOC family protein [Arenicellales bacterium]
MIKHIKFTELPVDDQDRAVKFYTEKIGFVLAQDVPYRDGWRWIELEIPGAQTRLLLSQRTGSVATDSPQLVLIVEDAAATYEDLSRNGVIFTKEPSQAPWNPGETFAQFRDSEGNGIVISSTRG